jgi:predicted nucleotidyltransferase
MKQRLLHIVEALQTTCAEACELSERRRNTDVRHSDREISAHQPATLRPKISPSACRTLSLQKMRLCMTTRAQTCEVSRSFRASNKDLASQNWALVFKIMKREDFRCVDI